jgi:hypothetical protein
MDSNFYQATSLIFTNLPLDFSVTACNFEWLIEHYFQVVALLLFDNSFHRFSLMQRY